MALYTVGALLAIGSFTGILGQALPFAIAEEAALLLDIILRTGPAEAARWTSPVSGSGSSRPGGGERGGSEVTKFLAFVFEHRHGNQGAAARAAFQALSYGERQALLELLDSI